MQDVPTLRADEIRLRCVRCDKPIEPCHSTSREAAYAIPYKDAGVDQFAAGYGSDHDCAVFVVGICDACLTQRLLDGAIAFEYSSLSLTTTADGYKEAWRKMLASRS